MGIFKNIGVSDLANWSSIVGVVITLITFLVLFGIKRQFLFRSRVNEHNESLDIIASNVSDLLQSFSKNTQEIDNEFAIADVKLRNIQKGASGDLLSDVKKARKLIKRYNYNKWFHFSKTEKSDETAREIRTALNVVIEELKNVRKELMIGK